MLNEDAERIKKTLECCTNHDKKCFDCPYESGGADCIDKVLADSLALIEEYEKMKEKLIHMHLALKWRTGEKVKEVIEQVKRKSPVNWEALGEAIEEAFDD